MDLVLAPVALRFPTLQSPRGESNPDLGLTRAALVQLSYMGTCAVVAPPGMSRLHPAGPTPTEKPDAADDLQETGESSSCGASRPLFHAVPTGRHRSRAEHVTGIEPALDCLEGSRLTIRPHVRKSGWRESNPLPLAWHASAQPDELHPRSETRPGSAPG